LDRLVISLVRRLAIEDRDVVRQLASVRDHFTPSRERRRGKRTQIGDSLCVEQIHDDVASLAELPFVALVTEDISHGHSTDGIAGRGKFREPQILLQRGAKGNHVKAHHL
jgi:hypothetical protein